MKATTLGLAIAGALLLAACSREQPEGAKREPEPSTAAPAEKTTATEPAHEAVAQVGPTQGNTVTGALALDSSPQGVRITGAIQGLKPDAEFGFHVHEKGDCSAPDGSSAGGHFNPTQAQHGNPTGAAHHAGDMPNIKSNAEGVAQVDTTAAGTSLHGEATTDILGKAIVVHESPDDYTTQPSGNSGKRVACGVIAAPSSP
ncbi:MAG TPA: superoxide dismutase family protein [Steroidobacteraceae bacterium]|nr:superoxide dismutase family protein [Steroidobacteraceae bacterium]